MTVNFKGYLEELDLESFDTEAIRMTDKDSKYMAANSLTLPGAKIFDLVQKGTVF